MNSELWSSYVGQKLHGLLFPCKFRRIKGKACHSSKIVIITPLEMIHSPAHMESGFFSSFGKFWKVSEMVGNTKSYLRKAWGGRWSFSTANLFHVSTWALPVFLQPQPCWGHCSESWLLWNPNLTGFLTADLKSGSWIWLNDEHWYFNSL